MIGWHHSLNGHEFEQTQGHSEGQGSLACCSPWGHRARHDLETEQQPEEFYAASSSSSKFLIKNPLSFQFLFPAGNVLCQGASVVSNIWHLVPSRHGKLMGEPWKQ